MPGILELARLLRRLVECQRAIDEESTAAGPGKTEADKAQYEVWGNAVGAGIEGIERALSALPATSLAEAAVQIMLCQHYCSLARGAGDGDQFESRVGVAKRLARSAMRAVERAAGADLVVFPKGAYVAAVHQTYRPELEGLGVIGAPAREEAA